ncbi:hypothetical protein KEJ51_06925 [Candidatus Bathyarchaeota archaeon]|nr:hypothetical protein [Candidatus Bathyarchaeota archaeon]MBS7629919.1 hypothetical protein [Candidatus Bathyarchaeota archaeon]
MVVIKGHIPEDLERNFRRKAMERYGYSKGAISKALEKAIQLWLEQETDETEQERINNEAYARLKNEIFRGYFGKYVAMENGEIVASGESLRDVWLPPRRKASHRLVFKVGEEYPRSVRLGWRVLRSPSGHTDK